MMRSVCNSIEPWEHGLVMRATQYPTYYDYNVIWVEGDPALNADELIAIADEKLDGYEHRRLDFESSDAAAKVRGDLEAAGWLTTKLVWMLHIEPLPPDSAAEVEEVAYDEILPMRHAWHDEDFPDVDGRTYIEYSREVAMTRDVRVIASREGDELVGFAQLERLEGVAEITQVYVSPEHRGNGRGTAITSAAVDAAGDEGDLWIVADDEDRPKELYGRLGFRPAWTSTEFLRLPQSG